jgi:hypothetical protein
VHRADPNVLNSWNYWNTWNVETVFIETVSTAGTTGTFGTSCPRQLLERLNASMQLRRKLIRVPRLAKSTTMIYTHVLNRGEKGVRSPADGL